MLIFLIPTYLIVGDVSKYNIFELYSHNAVHKRNLTEVVVTKLDFFYIILVQAYFQVREKTIIRNLAVAKLTPF